ncbi:MAG: OmpA family protein [Flavobacterium sp.]|uniref:OmpA family protein n=1 Tax=Flavobacterium sp. TaxID=239 RepID=UPI00263463CA|nr:OmpA family protein [Flavobacterium sp.]MDD5151409.1 OmpA family protein [Flavobacterium sp.]
MRNRILHTVLVLIASVNMLQSQTIKEAKAEKEYDKFAYVDAIKTYERLFDKGYTSVDMLEKLGNAYYFNADFEKAAKWYGELFKLNQEVTPEYYYRYAQSLKAIKDYEKADLMMAKFEQKSGTDLRAKLASSQKDYLAEIKKNSGRYTIENAGINSEYSDYGSSFYNNKVIFASARDTSRIGGKKHSWTGESFTNLYAADRGEEGSLSSVDRFGKSLNSKFHESTPVFTKDGKTVYFTRNNYLSKKGKDKAGTTLLKIYRATLEGDNWKDITELPFDSNEYSVAHPALSTDERNLYFASDMPGTIGESDLYKVAINSDGSYGTPENLGNVINTEGRETFPMITRDNELYFASDGRPGLGGLDVFVSKEAKDGSFKDVLNVGEPLNSSKDDFAFLIDNSTRLGYVTSNRDGGEGSDDIYRFKETKKIEYVCEQLLSGIVTDKATGLPLSNTKVTLFDSQSKTQATTNTDDKGYYSLTVECGKYYYVRTEKEDYSTSEKSITIANTSGKTDLPFELERSICKVAIGDDLGKCFEIKMIYFDLDKSFIRKDAAYELAKILDVLEQHPTMELDIRSHTDCRQTAKYNMALSDRRAKSTIAWLVSKGIAQSRLTGRGYGESQLVNDCGCEPTNQSNCTEEQHQANRRSEFIITAL